MYYFRFEIPTNKDGTRASYSPGWHGTLNKCPKNVTVLLYNDKEGYGIASSEDTFVPKEVTVLTEKDALNILSMVTERKEVYFGDRLNYRWDGNYHKYETCPYKEITCTEGFCNKCKIYTDSISIIANEIAKEVFGG